jgi:hypothetical protein
VALTGNKRRLRRGDSVLGRGAAASAQTIYDGALVGWDASGAIVPASDAAGVEIAGVAVGPYIGTTSSTVVTFESGHEEWIATGAGTIGAASVGLDACVHSDGGIQDAASSTYRVRVGRITQLDTINGTAGAWVQIRANATSAANEVATTGVGTGPLRVSNIPIGAVAYGSLGTNAVHVAGDVHVSEVYVPEAMLATGIAILNGDTVGTDKMLVALFDSTGAVVATSALAGSTTSGADAFQSRAFTAAVYISPGRYFIGAQADGGTDKTRRIAASTYLNRASITSGAFGTIAAITPPSTQTADAGPIGFLY